MIYAGIDIAKLNHYAAVLSSDGDGFKKLSEELSDYAPEPTIIGLESTAHYGDNLVLFLVTSDYKVCVLNPIQTSSRRKDRIRKTKTDKVDAIVIAETVMMQKSHRFVTFYDLDLMDLKTLGRFRQKSIKQRTRLKIQLTSYVDQVFPELQYVVKNNATFRELY
ncbi:IS110 family transposase [[Clostridium] aminophilum]|uniref:Transposase n=1 Tax=[Clostridium] aminophilum TaxID=1526 RepID=A0A1I6JIX6_9FIRM|nr:IS110 family transposase [[Clostridium] aminophilum]SFR78882.1 Transposase [[Clostridium] aminophilum]